MKRILIYLIVMGAVLMVPAERADIGKLKPVEVVYVAREASGVRIETDTGDAGQGGTLEKAFQDLKATTAGLIFLDTADYLLLDANAAELLDHMDVFLKPGVWVCETDPGVDLKEAAEFLAVHRPGMMLKERKLRQIGERLVLDGERMKLIEKNEK